MTMSGRKFLLRAEIADVSMNLMSVSRLEEHGYEVLFSQNQSKIMKEEWHTKIRQKSNLYQIEGDILAMRIISSSELNESAIRKVQDSHLLNLKNQRVHVLQTKQEHEKIHA